MNEHTYAQDKKSDSFKETASTIGNTISEASSKVKEHANKEMSGSSDSMCGKVGEGIKQTKEYISERGVSEMGSDLKVIIAKYPIYTVLVGMGLGALVSSLVCSKR
jgi:hypothetical protein